jgi:phosphoserine phosphatase RsbU/P
MEHSQPLILIADDDFTTVEMLQVLLRRAGFHTLSACTLREAGELVAQYDVSLILLDVHFPDGNGLELCRSLSARSSTPVLFISALEDLKTKIAGFNAGGVDYITKPLIGPEVLARVRTHLKLKAAYDNLATLQAERLQVLGQTQNRLMPLPADLPDARFQVALRQTNQAGGDFYDVIPLGDGVMDYIVADVCGHDLTSSLWTASFKTLLTEYAVLQNSPLEICELLNRALRRILPDGGYFTALYMRLNRKTMQFMWVNAGHPPLIILPVDSHEPELVEQTGDLLGIFEDVEFAVAERTVAPGDRIYAFTDGLIEQGRTRTKGLERLMEVCRRSAKESLDDSVFIGLASVCIPDVAEDDVVLMGVEV